MQRRRRLPSLSKTFGRLCEECRARLAGWDAYMGAIRETLRRYIGTEGQKEDASA